MVEGTALSVCNRLILFQLYAFIFQSIQVDCAQRRPIKLNHRETDWWAEKCHTFDRNLSVFEGSTLEQEMLTTKEFSVAFSSHGGCNSHFYHLLVNYAIPLFSKAVDPFLRNYTRVPTVAVHVHDSGGTSKLLQEMIPDLNITPSKWVFDCCEGHCSGVCGGHKHIPNYKISNDWFTGIHGYKGRYHRPANLHRSMVRRFKDHILSHNLVNVDLQTWARSSACRVVLVSRNKTDTPVTLGYAQSGTDRRTIKNFDELVTAAAKMAQQSSSIEFNVINAGAYTFKQQVSFFRRINVLSSLHGAAMAHCLWLPKESSAITITNKGHKGLFFEWLCKDVARVRYQELVVEDDFRVPVDSFLLHIKNQATAACH